MRITKPSVEVVFKEEVSTIEVVCAYSDLDFVRSVALYHGATARWDYIIDVNDIIVVAPKELDNDFYENWRATLLVIESAYFLARDGKVKVSLLPNCSAVRVIIKADEVNVSHLFDTLRGLVDV